MIILLMKIYNKLGSCRKSARNQNLHSFQICGLNIIDMAKKVSLLPVKKKSFLDSQPPGFNTEYPK
jgi:hypothetical protein